MPAHNADLNDPRNVLRILLALTLEANGELRLKATTYDSLDRARLLLIDYDKRKNEIALRSTTDFGRVARVDPEAFGWIKPPEAAPMERARVQAEVDVQRRSIPSDEDLADLEEAQQRKQRLARAMAEGKIPTRFVTKPPEPPKPQ